MPDVYFETDKILIVLNKDDFKNYKLIKTYHSQYSHLAALSSSLFILPALVMFIEGIRKEIEHLTMIGKVLMI